MFLRSGALPPRTSGELLIDQLLDGIESQGERQACRRGDLNPHALAGTSPSS
jgi:hypothetical protein